MLLATVGPIPGSPSIDKALKIEPWARRDVLSTPCPLNVRSCVAGACTYLQQKTSAFVLGFKWHFSLLNHRWYRFGP